MAPVGIITASAGNHGSVTRALDAIGAEWIEVKDPAALDRCGVVLMPGVGALPTFMRDLRASGLDEGVTRVAGSGRPVLGVCVGMQALGGVGHEFEETRGLGLIGGEVREIEAGVKPHMGWNRVEARAGSLVGSIEPDPVFYFVHGYALTPSEVSDVTGVVTHGGEIVASVERGNVFGAQFHPEKSQEAGLEFLRAFVRLAA